MHADAAYRHRPQDNNRDLWVSVALAVGVHVLVALLFVLAWLWSPTRDFEPAAGSPVIEAALVVSSADIRAAEQAMQDAPKPEPLPEPVEEVAEQETVPPPQPIPEPRPQDSPVPQQQQAQERIPVPDTEDQEAASRLAISQEKALEEQEAKRRQEQIDLTERERQAEAERKQRLAKQQEEADRQAKLEEIRRKRAQAARETQLAEQRLQQITNARNRQAEAASSAAASAVGSPPPGQGGTANDLLAKYQAALQQAITDKWTRPDSVPLGTRCRIVIRQIPGGEVIEAQVQAGCPFDEMGKRSIEAAVLKAQPLPYSGFESVFNRTLILNFEAQDR
jgi:colicin import membrane protein